MTETTTQSLQRQTVELATRFRGEANRLDEAFLKTADVCAVQGGSVCERAAAHREFSRKLFDLSVQMVDEL